jgi:ATP-dependent Clp protease ATP-binding subunit ClpA
MFERFTERARRVVVHAQEEARELSHSYIGTEHLLLGLMREQESAGARALQELEISQDAVREQVVQIVGRGKQAPSGHIPFTPRAKKVLELSLREALQLGHDYIGTEHILLGLIREGEGVAAQVLTNLGGELSRVRAKVIELIPAAGEPAELTAQLRRPAAGVPLGAVTDQLDTIVERLDTIADRLAAIERHVGLGGGRGQAGAGPGGAAPGRAEAAPAAEEEPGGGGPRRVGEGRPGDAWLNHDRVGSGPPGGHRGRGQDR